MEFDIDRLHRWARAAAPMATALAETAQLNADTKLGSGSTRRKGIEFSSALDFPER